MSVLVELSVEYNRFFSKSVIALAREDYVAGRMYLERAAKALNELAARRTGENRDYTQAWVFDIVKEIGDLDRRINNERSKDKVMKMLAERGKLKTDGDVKNTIIERNDIPETSFEDIAGLDDVKEAVMYKVIYPHRYPELYEKLRKRSGGGILLYGLPGTGKTLIAEAIAHETGASFFSVKCSDLGSKWFGETEQNIKAVFDRARAAKNAVIFFDELEAYASNRRDDGAMERSVPEFLAQMQGVGDSSKQERILVLGATNKPWRLDGAFLRPGRFDDKIYVPLPDEKARRKIIDDRVQGVPMEEGIDFENLSKITEGYNGADMDYLCEKAKEFALHRVIKDKDTNESLIKADFDLAIECVKSSVLEADKKEMELWIKNNRS